MFHKFLYYCILLPISWLPFKILYVFSDLIYFVLYSIVGYRKKVVSENLRNSFPEKSAEELKKIEKKFYRHLCDLLVESIKAFSISNVEASKRMMHRNPELINRFYEKHQSLVMVGGHYGNWELFAVTIAQQVKHQTVALYTPLKNKFFNQKILSSRSKFGLKMLSIQLIREKIEKLASEPNLVIFGSDQSPRKNQRAYWMNFLEQETGVQFGTEKFASKYNLPVIFGNIYKIKRGFYEVEYSVITDNPSQTAYGEITQLHTKKLEEIIKNEPAYWLWSHKRWKHKRPKEEVLH